jgi:antitoxin component of MazEF toxin-antitoxin module
MTKRTVRRTGNSLAIVLPRDLVRAKGLKAGDEVEVTVEKARTIMDMFGVLKDRGPSLRKLNDLSNEGEDLG